MVKRNLIGAFVCSLLQVLDQHGPLWASQRHRRPRHRHHNCNRSGYRWEPEVILDLEWLHRTGGDPGAGPSRPGASAFHRSITPLALQRLIGGRILCRFTHLATPNRLGRLPGGWNPPTRP
jgi:hypothetical protein